MTELVGEYVPINGAFSTVKNNFLILETIRKLLRLLVLMFVAR